MTSHPENSKTLIVVACDSELVSAIDKLAEEREQSRSQLIRLSVKRFIAEVQLDGREA